jgi:hypothetical protein
MNLKAGAQSIGLETNSIGWEILDKLVAEHDNNPEWADIWNALTAGKVLVVSHRQTQRPHLDLCALGDVALTYRERRVCRYHG